MWVFNLNAFLEGDNLKFLFQNKKSIQALGYLMLGFLIAQFIQFGKAELWAEDRYQELQNFSKVLNLVQQYYVEDVDLKKLIYGGIKGMLKELDPHTNFLPPEIFKEFESETSGEFGGLGIEISVADGVLTIISPIEDAPAWQAGIKAGDKIIGINGQSTKGLSLVEAAQLMRGKRGESVVLTIVRGDEDVPREFKVVRGNVKIKSVKYTDLGDGYAFIKVTSFIENTYKDLLDTLKKVDSSGVPLKGIVLDLRKNPGGLLDQAIKISDLFLDSGVIVSTIGRNPKEKEIVEAKKDGGRVEVPLVVLINDFSASASEIVAGALQDNKRALVVGTKSFGKGSVQSVVKLGDGSGLKLTVARYYTPNGRSIQAEGIVPDIEIQEMDADTFRKSLQTKRVMKEKDMDGHLLGEKEKQNKAKGSEGLSAWWRDLTQKSEESKMTAGERLLRSDYQAYQAFNYLKTWKFIRK